MSKHTEPFQQATIKQQCKLLRIPMVACQFIPLAEQAVKEKQNHFEYLEALLAAELEERERNTVERRIREAHLPRVKTLEEFDFSQCSQVNVAQVRELAEGGYIERAEPVLFIESWAKKNSRPWSLQARQNRCADVLKADSNDSYCSWVMVKAVRGMTKTRSSELRKADTKTNRRYLIAGLMIAVAAGLYIAIYRHSASVQATVPTTAQTSG